MTHVATLTIDNTKVAADLTDFPIYAKLSDMGSNFWDTVKSTTLENELVSRWSFDESSGSANDAIGVNALTNANVTYAAGKLNNGATFNGTTSKFTKTSSGLGTATTLTVAIWVKFSSTQQGHIVVLDNGSGNATLQLKANDNAGSAATGYLSVGTWNGSSASSIQHSGSYNDGNWKLVILELNGATMKLFVNNSEVASGSSGNFAIGLSTIKLGAALSDVQWYNGMTDEMLVWTRVLTAAEKTELYAAGSGTQAVTSGGDIRVFKSDGTTELPREVVSCKKLSNSLVSYYAFDEASGDANDSIGSDDGVNTSVTYTSGKVANSAVFDRTIPSKLAVTGPGALPKGALSVWVKGTFATDINDYGIFSKEAIWNANGQPFIYFRRRDGEGKTPAMGFDIYGNSAEAYSTTNITPGTWTHCVWSWNTAAKTIKFYINGVLSNTVTLGTMQVPVFTSMSIGKGILTTRNYTGELDEFGLYSREPSAEEVALLYNSNNGRSLDSMDSTGSGELHMKYSGTLSGSVDTDIQIHADGTSADYSFTSTYGRNAVWSSYEGVYHLNDATDSKGALHLTQTGSVSFVDGKLGKSASFGSSHGHSNRLANTTSIGTHNSDQTWSAYVKINTALSGGNTYLYLQSWYFATQMKSKHHGYIRESSVNHLEGEAGACNSYSDKVLLNSPSVATWYLLHTTQTGSTLNFYANGSLIGTRSVNTGNGSCAAVNGFYLGNNIEATNGPAVDMDETRFRSSLLSANWIETEANNQLSPSTFYSVSSPASGPQNIKTVTGVAIANVKTINGLALNTIKQINNQ